MGMFDNIHVKANKINLPLPKDGYYQTKWLDSNLCEIQMDEEGRMTCPDYKGCEMYPVEDVATLDAGNYDAAEFHFHGTDINGKWHEFTAVVKQSRITKLWSYEDLLYDEHDTAPRSDYEKTVKWLTKVLLPQFFENSKGDLLDDDLAGRLQGTLDEWKRTKLRKDNTVVTAEYFNGEILVKVDNVTICSFN